MSIRSRPVQPVPPSQFPSDPIPSCSASPGNTAPHPNAPPLFGHSAPIQASPFRIPPRLFSQISPVRSSASIPRPSNPIQPFHATPFPTDHSISAHPDLSRHRLSCLYAPLHCKKISIDGQFLIKSNECNEAWIFTSIILSILRSSNCISG